MVQIITCHDCCDLLLEKCFVLTQEFKTLASNNFAVVHVLQLVVVVAPWDQAPDQSVYDISPDRLGLKKTPHIDCWAEAQKSEAAILVKYVSQSQLLV